MTPEMLQASSAAAFSESFHTADDTEPAVDIGEKSSIRLISLQAEHCSAFIAFL